MVCYAPTNSESRQNDIADKDNFYNQHDDTVSAIPKHDMQIINGDFNTQLGNDSDTWKPALRKHAEGELNNNGTRLLSFCLAHKLVVGSSLFPHKRIHKMTWNSPDGRTVIQIDHSIINQKWCNSLKDVRVFRGADVGSDHNLAKSTVRLSLAAIKHQKWQPRYDISKLQEDEILVQFNATIGCRYHALAELNEETDIDAEWNNFLVL